MKLSDVLNRAIDLSRKVREYYERELPKRHPAYPLVGPGEETAPPPPEEEKLRAFLAGLSEDMIYQLVLIMYLGRGDVTTDDLAGAFRTLKGTFGQTKQAASRLVAIAPLADQLVDGLEELRKHNIDVDGLPLKKVRARK
jgi:hypothetical protein